MFQKFKRMCRKAKKTIMQVSQSKNVNHCPVGRHTAMAQSTAGDYSAVRQLYQRSGENCEIRSCHGQTCYALLVSWHHRSHFGVYRLNNEDRM